MRACLSFAVVLVAAVAAAPVSPRAADSGGPLGPWLTEDGSAVVQIAECGPALCGKIIWSQKPVDGKGVALCGRPILGDAVKSGADSWGQGWIYSPKRDDRYPVTLKLAADGTLHLHISAGLFGSDQTWTRPSQAVTPCGA